VHGGGAAAEREVEVDPHGPGRAEHLNAFCREAGHVGGDGDRAHSTGGGGQQRLPHMVAVVLAVPGDQRSHITKQESDGIEGVGAVGDEQVPLAVGLERCLLLASHAPADDRWEQGRLDARAQVADAIPGVE
jgi:hypothetical protein